MCAGGKECRVHRESKRDNGQVVLVLPILKREMGFSAIPFHRIFDFVSLKTDVNVPSKSNKQKNFFLNEFFVVVLKVNNENSRIRIH